MKHGRGSLLVFSGFDGTEEELGLVSTNFWLYKDNDMDKSWVLRKNPTEKEESGLKGVLLHNNKLELAAGELSIKQAESLIWALLGFWVEIDFNHGP